MKYDKKLDGHFLKNYFIGGDVNINGRVFYTIKIQAPKGSCTHMLHLAMHIICR